MKFGDRIRIANIVLNNFKNDSRVLKISKTLAQSGAQVTVIALHEDPLPRQESIEGFDVDRVWLRSNSWPKRKLFHALKYLEFSFRVLRKYRNYEVYHCNDLHTLPVGVLLKLFSRWKAKIVYDAHEYETEANGVGAVERILRRMLEGFLIRFADRTITVSDSIANEYVRLYGIEKPALILNLPMLSAVGRHNRFRDKLGISEGQRIFLYQGGLSPGRGIETLLNAFASRSDSANVCVFMGYGPLAQMVETRAAQSDSIYFHEAVPPEQIPLFTSSADVGISTIENTCLSYYYCLPNKLFEYAMAEIPVIVSNMHEMKKMVEQYKLGVVAEENSVEGIQRAISAIDSFDREAFHTRVKAFKQQYHWEAQEKLLVAIYGDLSSVVVNA